MQFGNFINNNGFGESNSRNYFYEVEYLPSIFEGKIDQESLF